MYYKRSVFRSLAMVTQLGLSVITPIFLCIFAGYQLDSRFGTKTMIPLLIMGVLAGGRSAWVLVKKTLAQAQADDDLERQRQLVSPARAGVTKPKESSRIRRTEAEEVKHPSARQQKKERDNNGMA